MTVSFKNTVVTLAREGEDYTLRQLGVMILCRSTSDPQTVRGMAAELKVSKPAITRAVDKLEAAKLVVRKNDPADRRSVLMSLTDRGAAFIDSYWDSDPIPQLSAEGTAMAKKPATKNKPAAKPAAKPASKGKGKAKS